MMKNISDRNLAIFLFFFKVVLAILSFSILDTFYKDSIFAASDISTYGHCNNKISNVIYTKILCNLNISSINELYASNLFYLAILINSLIAVGFFILFKNYINFYGRIFLILALLIHPYLAIYSTRFYSDIFGIIGIFIITLYIVKNKNVDFVFLALSILLIHSRTQLLPVYLAYSLLSIYSSYQKSDQKNLIYSFLLLVISLISLFFYKSFAIFFFIGNDAMDLIPISKNPIWWNLISLISFRELVGVGGPENFLNYLNLLGPQFIVMGFLLFFHFVGLIGLIKFSMKNEPRLVLVFLYALPTLLSVSHLRYFLPLIPLAIFGVSYMLFKNNKS